MTNTASPSENSSRLSTMIWDWNGTLLDDTWLCVDIINGVLDRRGLPTITIEAHREIFDFPIMDYYHRLGFDFEIETFEVLGDEFMGEYEQRKFECDLFPDVLPSLDRLHKMGINQCILSAYHHGYLTHILEHFKLLDRFDHVFGNDDHYAGGKEVQALRLKECLNLKGSRALMIGDSVHDEEVARAADFDCILVTTGTHPEYKLKATGSPVHNSIQEALDSLDGV